MMMMMPGNPALFSYLLFFTVGNVSSCEADWEERREDKRKDGWFCGTCRRSQKETAGGRSHRYAISFSYSSNRWLKDDLMMKTEKEIALDELTFLYRWKGELMEVFLPVGRLDGIIMTRRMPSS